MLFRSCNEQIIVTQNSLKLFGALVEKYKAQLTQRTQLVYSINFELKSKKCRISEIDEDQFHDIRELGKLCGYSIHKGYLKWKSSKI